MAEANQAKVEQYPLSDQSGNAIPFDVGQPVALGLFDCTVTPSALIDIPDGVDIITVESDTGCVVSFGAVVPSITEGTFFSNLAKIPGNSIVYLAVPPNITKRAISLVRSSIEDGQAWVQCYRTWRALKQQTKSI